jgi:hypothetical protein
MVMEKRKRKRVEVVEEDSEEEESDSSDDEDEEMQNDENSMQADSEKEEDNDVEVINPGRRIGIKRKRKVRYWQGKEPGSKRRKVTLRVYWRRWKRVLKEKRKRLLILLQIKFDSYFYSNDPP